jgi:putative addiction module killer protein
MTDQPRTLRVYSTPDGRKPFQEWIDSLNDYDAQARVLVRLERVRLGSLGDWKSVGEGVQELRINVGPGYRVYFGQDGQLIVILLCGGKDLTVWREEGYSAEGHRRREEILAGLQEPKRCHEA